MIDSDRGGHEDLTPSESYDIRLRGLAGAIEKRHPDENYDQHQYALMQLSAEVLDDPSATLSYTGDCYVLNEHGWERTYDIAISDITITGVDQTGATLFRPGADGTSSMFLVIPIERFTDLRVLPIATEEAQSHLSYLTDYSQLGKEPKQREFVARVVSGVYENVPEGYIGFDMSMQDIQGYIEYLEKRIAALDEEDEGPDDGVGSLDSWAKHRRTAADVVFSLIKRFAVDDGPGLSTSGAGFVRAVDAHYCRKMNLTARIDARSHSDPIIASFYETFWNHLDNPQSGERRGTW